jgi:hypothetical protein
MVTSGAPPLIVYAFRRVRVQHVHTKVQSVKRQFEEWPWRPVIQWESTATIRIRVSALAHRSKRDSHEGHEGHQGFESLNK